MLYSLHNGLVLIYKYTSTRASEFKQRITITWDAISVVDE